MLSENIDIHKEPTDLKGLLSLIADEKEIILTDGDHNEQNQILLEDDINRLKIP